MRDFYATSKPIPLDQADGLRRLFHGRALARQRTLALAANPFVPYGAAVLDRLAAVLAARGRKVLVVDAAENAPLAAEMTRLDLAAGIEFVAEGVGYMAARGLPLAHVDTRGSASGFIDAVQTAAPWADVLLLHADSGELARLFKRRATRPVLMGADQPDSIKHAYASAKFLVQRCQLTGFDLVLAAPPQSPRVLAISKSLARCTETFLGAWVHHCAVVDPTGDPAAVVDDPLSTLLASQLVFDDSHWMHAATGGRVPAPALTQNRFAT